MDTRSTQSIVKYLKKYIPSGILKEAKKYDIGMAMRGSGITVYNRAESEFGDYKNIAHIKSNGMITYYDKKLPKDIKAMIEKEANSLK